MNHSRPRSRATIASRNARANATQPMAMHSCGIHSGVASAEGDTSCVMYDSHTARTAYQAR